jgi:hypothetical protein
MKTYIEGYKKKSLTLFRLCLEAKDYDANVYLEYLPYNDQIQVVHYTDGNIKKQFNIDLDLLDHTEKLDEAIAYVTGLIEGDNDVRT